MFNQVNEPSLWNVLHSQKNALVSLSNVNPALAFQSLILVEAAGHYATRNMKICGRMPQELSFTNIVSRMFVKFLKRLDVRPITLAKPANIHITLSTYFPVQGAF